MDERIEFGLYQSCGNRGVFGVYLCLSWWWGVGRVWNRIWKSGVVLCLCKFGLFV